MSPSPDPIVMGLIFALASAIVAVGWFACVGLVGLFLHRKVGEMERTHGPLPAPESSALLLYGLALFFWPAGFVLGATQLGKPATTLQARNLIYVGLGNISVIVVLTCLGMTALGFLAPDLMGF